MCWVATEPVGSDQFWGRKDAASEASLARAFAAGVRFYAVELEKEMVYFFTGNDVENELAAIFS